MAGGANGVRERLTGDRGNGCLAGRINVGEHKHVRLVECAAEFVPKMLGSRVAMRLKENQQPIELAAARGFERGANLGRMMAVVVNQGNPVDGALDVKAAAYACELFEALADQVRGNIQIQRHGSGSGGVADVVNARRSGQTEFSQVVAAIGEAELALEALQFDVADHQVRLARRAVGDDGPLHFREDGLDVRLIEAKNHRAVERHAVHALYEGVLNLFERDVLVKGLAVNRGDEV